ncbi:hypothetical protein HPP92_021537 [Vanilla planifolia]|uniref:Uncharacterized protein n=1 Tax=Vanilla planifolia TaxID=51239 RepID=A0A835PVR7_VANPL|nr:hypothetical protein HPP92_021537 [Vanilla planifolia]
MLGLQRSTETFRRSGSSGLVWEDRHLPAEMNASLKPGAGKGEDSNVVLRQSQSAGTIGMMRRSRSGSGGGGGGRLGGGSGGGAKSYRTDQVERRWTRPSEGLLLRVLRRARRDRVQQKGAKLAGVDLCSKTYL